MAFIIPKQGETLTKEEILEFLQGKVAKYKFPTYVKFVDELPMTASGRIKKAELRKEWGIFKDREKDFMGIP